jgi:hypothetical protein
MKNLLSLIFIGIVSIFSSCTNITAEGNGDIITMEQSVSFFDEIKVSSSATVQVHKDSETHVTLAIDSNLLEYVQVEVRNKALHIGIKKGVSSSFTKFIVDVYCPNIRGVEIDGSGNIILIDKMITPSFNINISGTGNGSRNIEGAIECETFSASIRGAGNIMISGRSRDADINISGSGNFNGKELKTNNCTASTIGTGNVSIWVTEHLKVSSFGSGNVTYLGTPKIDIKGIRSGKVKGE